MRQVVHVNQQAIARNRRRPDGFEPPIIARTYKGVKHGFQMNLQLPDGTVVGQFVYRPHNPLPCGARLWLELDTNVCKAVPA